MYLPNQVKLQVFWQIILTLSFTDQFPSKPQIYKTAAPEHLNISFFNQTKSCFSERANIRERFCSLDWMDQSDLCRANTSLRANSSSFWRNSGLEIFSHSTQQEDDEVALKWAALEKLPTYDRLTRGLLVGPRGSISEVDIRDLGFQERKDLLERLLKVADEDNEKFLLKLRERIDRWPWISKACVSVFHILMIHFYVLKEWYLCVYRVLFSQSWD